ncbi:MAG: OB-fold domain-containing protein [Jannaschia sp.]
MQTAATPPRVLGLYDRPMWDILEETGTLHLQRCSDCGHWRYPPGPCCPDCLSPDFAWTAVSGTGTVVSWVTFHKQYLEQYPAPYNVVAVRLSEGPILISNLVELPVGNIIGRRVSVRVIRMDDGVLLPRFELEET